MRGLARILATMRSKGPRDVISLWVKPVAVIAVIYFSTPLSAILCCATLIAIGSISDASIAIGLSFAMPMAKTPLPVPRSRAFCGFSCFITLAIISKQPAVVP